MYVVVGIGGIVGVGCGMCKDGGKGDSEGRYREGGGEEGEGEGS